MRPLGLTTLLLIGAMNVAGEEKTGVKPTACCGVTYTSVKCSCPSERPSGCPCDSCSRDEKCSCVAALKKGTGTVIGKVKSRYIKKYPTVVYVEEIPGKQFPPPTQHAKLDQKGKAFKPRVLPVLVGTTVDFLNGDDFEHNVFSPDGEKYNLGKWQKGEVRKHIFKKAGTYAQLCAIHPEMIGHVLVLKTPYYVVVKKDGTFEIPNVPPGSWTIKVWNERFRRKSLKKDFTVTVVADKVTEVELKP